MVFRGVCFSTNPLVGADERGVPSPQRQRQERRRYDRLLQDQPAAALRRGVEGTPHHLRRSCSEYYKLGRVS